VLTEHKIDKNYICQIIATFILHVNAYVMTQKTDPEMHLNNQLIISSTTGIHLDEFLEELRR